VSGRGQLVIDRAVKRDDGTYMCVAENAAGTRRAVAAVRVQGQAPPTVFDCFTTLRSHRRRYRPDLPLDLS